MFNRINNKDKFSLSKLLNSLKEINNDTKKIGGLERDIAQVKQKKELDIYTTKTLAANYFTKERIKEIHDASITILKNNDFDEEEFIEKFGDISTIELADIEFLIEKMKLINEWGGIDKKKWGNIEISGNSFLEDLYDCYQRGVSNDD